MASLSVASYTIDAFKDFVTRGSGAKRLTEKAHFSYFKSYFDGIGAKTLIFEDHYIDHDFLEDFAGYYVRCFAPYRKECARIHVFSSAFTEEEFRKLLRGENSTVSEVTLKDGYKGFVVVRPLPESVFGRTCMVHYPTEHGRVFPTVTPFASNLFGIDLCVKTVPFQEQDKVTAACATSALWSAFQTTTRLFQHALVSPVEITALATKQMPIRSRTFPNVDGLNLEQMAHAIRNVGLEPYLILPKKNRNLLAGAYAYLNCGIPVVLVFELRSTSQGKGRVLGYHAATITGYCLQEIQPEDQDRPYLTSNLIKKFYVHDDQVGPHARMEVIDSNVCLTTSWGQNSSYENIRAYPAGLLIPLYNKIRLPYLEVIRAILTFDEGLYLLREVLGEQCVWDVRLNTVNQFKREFSRNSAYTGEDRQRVLCMRLPRFIWRATAKVDGKPLLDVIIDATDIASGKFVQAIEVYNPTVRTILKVARTSPDLKETTLGRRLNHLYCLQAEPS